MPRLTLTRGEIDLLISLCSAAEAAGTEFDVYETLTKNEKATWFDRLRSTVEKLCAVAPLAVKVERKPRQGG